MTNTESTGKSDHKSDRFHPHCPTTRRSPKPFVALEEHGFSVDVVDNLDAARVAVLARVPKGSSVMTNTSVTLDETGIAEAINNGGEYDSARNKLNQLDYADATGGDEGGRRPDRLTPSAASTRSPATERS